MKPCFIAVVVLLFVAGCSGSGKTQAVPSQPPSPSQPAIDLPAAKASPTPTCRTTTDDADAAYYLRVAARAVKVDTGVTFQQNPSLLCSSVTVGAAWYTVSIDSDGGRYNLVRVDASQGVYNGAATVAFTTTAYSGTCQGRLILAYVGGEPNDGEFPQLQTPEVGDKKYKEVVGIRGRIVGGEYYPPSSPC